MLPTALTLNNPPGVRRYLQAVGKHQDVLRVGCAGNTQPIRASTLVFVATLGKGVRTFLYDALLYVARHERAPRVTPGWRAPTSLGRLHLGRPH